MNDESHRNHNSTSQTVQVCIRTNQTEEDSDCPLIWASGIINEENEFIDDAVYQPGEYFINPGF